MKVSIIVPFILRDIKLYIDSLNKSLLCIVTELAGYDVNVIFVPQADDQEQFVALNEYIDKISHSISLNYVTVKIIHLERTGISLARNAGLDVAEKAGASHVYFHDVSISVTSEFVKSFVLMAEVSDIPCMGVACFEHVSNIGAKRKVFQKAKVTALVRRRSYPALNSYVWSYLFPVNMLKGVRFDERIGPGKHTSLKAGEDYLFIGNVVRKSGYKILCMEPDAYVYHPPRNADDDKYLIYARGQGYAYRQALVAHKRPSDLLFILLFLANGILKVLMRKKHARKILSDRLSGLFASDILT